MGHVSELRFWKASDTVAILISVKTTQSVLARTAMRWEPSNDFTQISSAYLAKNADTVFDVRCK